MPHRSRVSHPDSQAGIVLVVVLVMLALFGVVGVTFTFYASERQCEQNPTVELRDGTCLKTIGTERR
jgi:Tfp pilus assembly protein PilX